MSEMKGSPCKCVASSTTVGMPSDSSVASVLSRVSPSEEIEQSPALMITTSGSSPASASKLVPVPDCTTSGKSAIQGLRNLTGFIPPR